MRYITDDPFELERVELCKRCNCQYVRPVSLGSSVSLCADCSILRGYFPELLGGWTRNEYIKHILSCYYEEDLSRRVWVLKRHPFFTAPMAITSLVIAILLFVSIWSERSH